MKLPDYVKGSSAEFSEDKKYRYWLERIWKDDGGLINILNFIMLNPSTADVMQDDNSVRKCTNIAHREGYEGVRILNLFAIRSTDPKLLYESDRPIGPKNDDILTRFINHNDNVLAWGNHGKHLGRDKIVLSMFRYGWPGKIYCLDINKTGSPKHPLYVRNNIELKPYLII